MFNVILPVPCVVAGHNNLVYELAVYVIGTAKDLNSFNSRPTSSFYREEAKYAKFGI